MKAFRVFYFLKRRVSLKNQVKIEYFQKSPDIKSASNNS